MDAPKYRAALTAAMERHADGDASAFQDVYVLVAHRLEAFFLRHTRDPARATDLVQETLLRVHSARHTFVRGSDVVPWIYAIGRRLLVDSLRRSRKEVFFATPEEEAEALEHGVSSDGAPEELAVTRQMEATVLAELARLPGPQRAVFELVRVDGRSIAEAADVLGTTTSAAKQRLFRASEALRGALGIGDRGALAGAPGRGRLPVPPASG